jgi:hypothetical protein
MLHSLEIAIAFLTEFGDPRSDLLGAPLFSCGECCGMPLALGLTALLQTAFAPGRENLPRFFDVPGLDLSVESPITSTT